MHPIKQVSSPGTATLPRAASIWERILSPSLQLLHTQLAHARTMLKSLPALQGRWAAHIGLTGAAWEAYLDIILVWTHTGQLMPTHDFFVSAGAWPDVD